MRSADRRLILAAKAIWDRRGFTKMVRLVGLPIKAANGTTVAVKVFLQLRNVHFDHTGDILRLDDLV